MSNFIGEKHCILHIYLHYHDETTLSTSWPGTGDGTPSRGNIHLRLCYFVQQGDRVKLQQATCKRCLNTIQNNYFLVLLLRLLGYRALPSGQTVFVHFCNFCQLPCQRCLPLCMGQAPVCVMFYIHTALYCPKWFAKWVP